MGGQPSKPKQDEEEKKWIAKPYGVRTEAQNVKLTPALKEFYESVAGLVERNKYSDLLIICGHDRFPVHRSIVCLRSRWFEDRCEMSAEVPDYTSPANPMRIYLDETEDSHIIAALLTFIYTLDYADSGPQLAFGLPSDQSSVHSNQELVDTSDNHHETSSVAETEDDTEPEPTPRPSSEFEEDPKDSRAEQINEWASVTHSLNSPLRPISSIHPLSETTSRTASPHSPLLTPTITPSGSPRSSSDILGDGKPSQTLLHTHLYFAAHRYGIPNLANVALEKLTKLLKSDPFWNKQQSWTPIFDCIREIYSHSLSTPSASTVSSPTGGRISMLGQRLFNQNGAEIFDEPLVAPLKGVVVHLAKRRFGVMKRKEGWEELLVDVPVFARDLLGRM